MEDRRQGLESIGRALKQLHDRRGREYKVTDQGLWATSDQQEVYDLFCQLDLASYRHLADLGSGDGRVVLCAALFTRATGLEIDPELTSLASGLAQGLGLSRASFVTADCRHCDLSPYDLLFIYPDKPLAWLEQRLPDPWPGRLVVYGPFFQPQSLRHQATLYAGNTLCSLWSR